MRRKLKLLILFLIFSILIAIPSSAQKDPKKLKFKDLEFKPIKPDFTKIKKGIDLYYKVDRENPVINMFLFFKVGSLLDPEGKEGLSSITFRLMKSGGTKNFPPGKLEERLDFLGSSISVSSGTEFSMIRMWCLKKNFIETWKILMDIIVNPVFDEERFDMEKKRELESIRRRWDNPMRTGMILFTELIYGKDFPDARRTTTESINRITLEDVKKFYYENIRDLELTIAIAGDFELENILRILKAGFKNWKGKTPEKLELPKAKLAAKPGIYLINKEDMTQAVICMGHLGINRLDPDNVEINVLNYIYGTGGFNSRLMREVRSHKGLAYTTFGIVGSGRNRGLFFNFCMTKKPNCGRGYFHNAGDNE
ncbi:insulinase family protein [Candidatus Aminicenantes bacterium AC-335-B20]|nr:insulinase family protein [Candidatus Aminicenantes bacterium AC-335-B20]